MSVTGVAVNMLFQAVAASAARKSHGNFAQVHSEVQQLGQDLQAGNLAGAQQDFAALAQNFPAAQTQTPGSSATPAATTGLTNTGSTSPGSTSTASTTTGTAGNSPAQAFSAVGQALQSGNLSAAQTAFATLQQDLSLAGGTQLHAHHHHRSGAASEGDGQPGQSAPAVMTGQANSIAQAFSSLLQDIQSGNLSAAQTAYATMQQELGPLASSGATYASTLDSTPISSLNVTV